MYWLLLPGVPVACPTWHADDNAPCAFGLLMMLGPAAATAPSNALKMLPQCMGRCVVVHRRCQQVSGRASTPKIFEVVTVRDCSRRMPATSRDCDRDARDCLRLQRDCPRLLATARDWQRLPRDGPRWLATAPATLVTARGCSQMHATVTATLAKERVCSRRLATAMHKEPRRDRIPKLVTLVIACDCSRSHATATSANARDVARL